MPTTTIPLGTKVPSFLVWQFVMNYDLIKLFYGWNVLQPKIEWYVQNGFIDAVQYKEITGKDYQAPATK